MSFEIVKKTMDVNENEGGNEIETMKSKTKTKIKSQLSNAKSSEEMPKKSKKRRDAKKEPAEDVNTLGFTPEKILGATEANGRIKFRIKIKNDDKWEIVKAKVAHKDCPDLVIAFYEKHLVLEGDYLDLDEYCWTVTIKLHGYVSFFWSEHSIISVLPSFYSKKFSSAKFFFIYF